MFIYSFKYKFEEIVSFCATVAINCLFVVFFEAQLEFHAQLEELERKKRKRKIVYSNEKYLILQCLHT